MKRREPPVGTCGDSKSSSRIAGQRALTPVDSQDRPYREGNKDRDYKQNLDINSYREPRLRVIVEYVV